MIACILAFIGIYATLLGITGFVVNAWSMVTIFDIKVPVSVVLLVSGFLVSLCVLGFIRMMGEQSGNEDSEDIQKGFKATAMLGFWALIATCIIQGYLRIQFGFKEFFIYQSENLAAVLQLAEPVDEVIMFFISIALPVMVGLPVFILLFFQQSFQEYVTVSYREIAGMRVEMSRSDSYLPIWPTLIIGILLSVALIFLALTPLVYLLLVPFSVYLFGCPDKKKMITAGVVSGIVAIAGIIIAFVA